MLDIIILIAFGFFAGYLIGNYRGYRQAYKLVGCGCGACAYAKSLGKCPAMAVYYDLDTRDDLDKSLDAYRGPNAYGRRKGKRQ